MVTFTTSIGTFDQRPYIYYATTQEEHFFVKKVHFEEIDDIVIREIVSCVIPYNTTDKFLENW